VALLIDEIDKADIEFPNDLLRELDRMEFYVLRDARADQGQAPAAGVHHLQQREGTARRLPAPLLLPLHQVPRRRDDAADRRRALPRLKKELLAAAMKTFYDVRNLPGLKKKPSTSELLDWLKLLVAEDIPLEALQSKDDKVAVPPLVGALLKNEQDVTLFEKLVFMNQRKPTYAVGRRLRRRRFVGGALAGFGLGLECLPPAMAWPSPASCWWAWAVGWACMRHGVAPRQAPRWTLPLSNPPCPPAASRWAAA
jgi:hypothetical protein